MPTWTIRADVSGNDSIGQAEAASWGVDEDFIPAIEHNEWDTPEANGSNNLLKFSGHAASEYDFFPGEVTVVPVEAQGDHKEWTLVTPPEIDE